MKGVIKMLPKSRDELARMIDHTFLKPNGSIEDIKNAINEALTYKFRSVVVPPCWVPSARKFISKESGVLLVSVVGFPLGYNSPEIKIQETRWLIQNGVDEIDMVMNISAFKSGDKDFVLDEIKKIVEIAKPIPVKVILETGYLTDDEIIEASKIAVSAGAAFVKTCTGFGPRGATVNDIKLMRQAVGTQAKVKAAGGIRDAKTALDMIKAGADVIGASRSINIVNTFSEDLLTE